MDKSVTLHPDQAVLHTDLMDMQSYVQQAIDLAISEAVADGDWYARMTTIRLSTWVASTAAGALYLNGVRFRNYATVDSDLFNVRPTIDRKIVAIIGTGSDRDSADELRDFATDAEGTTWEPRPVSTLSERIAKIEIKPGAEAAVPQAPSIPVGAVLIALVHMTAGGIERVEMNSAGELPQTLQNRLQIIELAAFQADFGQAIQTLRTDMAALNAKADGMVPLPVFLGFLDDYNQTKADTAKALDLALSSSSTFILQETETFATENLSDPDYAGYSGRIDRGLRFAFDATNDSSLELLNPLDDKLKIINNFALPDYTEVTRQSTWSGTYTTETLNAHTNVSITKRTGRRPVWSTGVGAEYVTRVSHVFTGSNITAPTSIVHGGRTYQLYDNEVDNSAGQLEIGSTVESILTYRISNKVVSGYETYTYDDVDSETFNAQGRAQVWVQPQAGWLTGIDCFLDEIGTPNDIRFLIGEANDGDPNIKKVLAEVILSTEDLKVAGTGPDDGMRIPIEPVMLAAGKRYALMMLTQGSHKIRVSSDKQGVVNGDFYHLGLNGWVKSTEAKQMQMRLVFARFNRTRLEVDMEPIELAGGINSVNIFTEVVQPAMTRLDYEVQINGVWYVLGEEIGARLAADLTTAGSLLPMRVAFVGTVDLMPGVGITATKSAVKTSRAATTINHISSVRDLGAGITAEVVRVRVRAENWDGGKHTLAIALIDGADAVIAPDATEETALDHDTVDFTATFTLAPELQSYRIKITGTTTDNEDQFYIAERQSSNEASV